VFEDGRPMHVEALFDFLYIFIMILQKYMVRKFFFAKLYICRRHGVRDITSWPTAVGAASSGLVALTPWVTALSP
jgi:hypothetical protein